MGPDEILIDTEEKMEAAIDFLTDEFKKLRTGRASPSLIEGIRVEYHGAPTPLRQIASIVVPDPRSLLVKPYDPSSLKEIEKAIQKAEIGLNPINDGKFIRLNIPPLTEERRKQLAALAREIAEGVRVRIRNARRDGNKSIDEIEEEGLISEDDARRFKKDIQKLTDDYIKKVDELLEKKTEEVMKI